MKYGRRQFLETTALGTAGVLVGTSVGEVRAEEPKTGDPMGPVTLGKTGIQAPRLGMGTGMRGGMRQSNHTRMGYEALEKLILYSYDQGARLFDLADLYGTHQWVMKMLVGKPRDSYVLVSKLWWREGALPESERPSADVCVKRFLKEMETDYIDILQLHCVTSSKWPEELAKQMEDLEKVKKEGLIRSHGVSCHSLGALEEVARQPWVDVVHARINAFGDKMDAEPEKVAETLRRIHEAGTGIIGMKLCGEGAFAGQPDRQRESVRFALEEARIDAMVIGFEQTEQLDEFKKHLVEVLA